MKKIISICFLLLYLNSYCQRVSKYYDNDFVQDSAFWKSCYNKWEPNFDTPSPPFGIKPEKLQLFIEYNKRGINYYEYNFAKQFINDTLLKVVISQGKKYYRELSKNSNEEDYFSIVNKAKTIIGDDVFIMLGYAIRKGAKLYFFKDTEEQKNEKTKNYIYLSVASQEIEKSSMYKILKAEEVPDEIILSSFEM